MKGGEKLKMPKIEGEYHLGHPEKGPKSQRQGFLSRLRERYITGRDQKLQGSAEPGEQRNAKVLPEHAQPQGDQDSHNHPKEKSIFDPYSWGRSMWR